MTTNKTKLRLGSLPVDELMERIKNQGNDSENAEIALYEFLRRYGDVVKAKCRYASGILLRKSSTILNLVYDHAIELVYYQAPTYKPCGTGLAKSATDRHVAQWLGVIAEVAAEQVGKRERAFYNRHVVSGEMETYSDLPAMDDPADENTDPAAELREFLKRKRLMTLEVAMGQLKPHERDIVEALTSPMAGKKYLDAGQIATICSKWKMSQDNLYQVKHRALGKIRKLMLAMEESGE